MSCLGVLFALDDDQVSRLLSTDSDEDVRSFIEVIEEAWDEPNLLELSKLWDAIGRCLANEKISQGRRLDRCILGGRNMYEGDDYIVSYVSKADVPALAAGLATVTKNAMHEAHFDLINTAYPAMYIDEESFEQTWPYFEDVQKFYRGAAASGRAVIFTADQ